MTFQTSALILSWFAILLLALVVSGLVRQVHALSGGAARRPEPVGLPAGAPAPGLGQLAPDRPVPLVLLFLSVDCRTCGEVLDEAVRSAAGCGLAIHALYAGPAPAGTSGLPVAVHGEQADLFERYDAIVTPFAVVVDQGGRVIQSTPLGSAAAFRALLEHAAGTVPVGPLGPLGPRGGRP
jgi:hypothetical protein